MKKNYNPKTGRVEKVEKPKKEKKDKNSPRPNQKIIIVKHVDPKKKSPTVNVVRNVGGRPRKIYTPEEIAEREAREKNRIEKTGQKRSKEFMQPWCETVLKFQNRVNDYFDKGATTFDVVVNGVTVEQKVYTWAGLAYYLGFSSRDSMNTFAKEKPIFKEVVEKAKLVVERAYEERLHSSNPTGAIFALKNFGWIETTKTDLNITVNPLENLLKQAARRELPKDITMVEDGK